MKKHLLLAALLAAAALPIDAHAQNNTAPQPQERLAFGFFEGTVVAGYVDRGAFLNFTGPNVSYTTGNSKILVGMLPSLRFKEDPAAVKNAFVTPTLGMGITYAYRKLALQLPLYYNPKTATDNGRWNLGFGIGVKLK